MEMNDSISTFFFPLRTNVQYFETPEDFLSLEERIKQAVILYDRVVFEPGLYEATVGPDAVFETYIPPSQPQLLGRRLRDRETVPDQSHEGFSIWAKPSGTFEPFKPLVSSPIERTFRAEFHSLFERLTAQFNVEGLELLDEYLTEEGEQQAVLWAKAHMEAGGAIHSEGSAQLQKHIAKGLFHDLVLASALGCAGSVDPLHGPLLDQIISRTAELSVASGFAALEFQVPNIATLPWDQITQIRADPAIVDFRQKLVDAESLVRQMLPEASESEIKLEVGRVLHQDLIEEVRTRMAPRGLKLAGSVAAQIAGGLIPPLGLIQTGYSVGKEVADSAQESKTWLAVLMKLNSEN